MSKWTGGEWRVANGLLVGEQRLFIYSDSGEVICRVTKEVRQEPLDEEDVANAHMIAAATKLFEALKAVTGNLEIARMAFSGQEASMMFDSIQAAHEAMAKARGEDQ